MLCEIGEELHRNFEEADGERKIADKEVAPSPKDWHHICEDEAPIHCSFSTGLNLSEDCENQTAPLQASLVHPV